KLLKHQLTQSGTMSTSAAEYHGPATTRSRYRSRTTKASSSSVSDELLEPSRSSSSSSSSDDSRSNTLSPSASNGDNDNKKDGHYGNDHENEHASSSSSSSFSILDIFRLLTGLLILNSALSYFVTNDSLIWGYKTHWLRPGAIQAWLRGPLELTPEQLLLYNGSAYPDLPIYLAVNGTVFDVSASPHHYGPGGGYHFFAGRDGARAFVTGCFMLEHVVPDLRGAEELYLPAATGPYTVEVCGWNEKQHRGKYQKA
ncbi:MAG: hypothetical protein M1838_001209, partial [Thelocarpon superellum]